MDHQTEAIVIERMKVLQKEGVGMLLSTHRMSLAAIATRFVVLEKGRVALNGPKEIVMQQLTGQTTGNKQERPASQDAGLSFCRHVLRTWRP